MQILTQETIRQLEEHLLRKETVELHMEKDQLVLVETSRKVKLKQPIERN